MVWDRRIGLLGITGGMYTWNAHQSNPGGLRSSTQIDRNCGITNDCGKESKWSGNNLTSSE